MLKSCIHAHSATIVYVWKVNPPCMRPCFSQLARLQEANAETVRAQKLLELMLEQQYLLKPPANGEPRDASEGKEVPAEEQSKPIPSAEALLSMVSDAVLKKQVHTLKVFVISVNAFLCSILDCVLLIRLIRLGYFRD